MDLDKPPAPQPPEGCLVVALRLPVRIVVLVLVVPVRLVWDALVVAGRFLHATLLRPLGRALLWVGRALFVWPFVALWRWVLVPVGTALRWLGNVLVVVPLCWTYARLLTPLGRWVYAYLLAPVGRGLAWLARGIGALLAAAGMGLFTGAAWLVRHLLVVPARWLYVQVLRPVGRALLWLADAALTGVGAALYWTLRLLLVLPALALWRWVLAPVGRVLAVVAREVADALGHAWRIAGRVSLVVGRALGTLFRWIFVEPARWAYRTVLTPVGHAVRDAVLRPAARAAREVGRVTRLTLAAARETRRELRRALFGDPRQPLAADRREPLARDPRTLGDSTTVLTKD
ncbi:hypothetical protein ACGFZR_28025 [Streptomyces sp. NPDC048241]|uniref:hypothetical protein n=1 Tax=Streptomyces sp. NPDC048241 TaxID=3365521 RepID=UPI0037136C61